MSAGPTRWQVATAFLQGLLAVAVLWIVLHAGVTYVAPARVVTSAANSLRPVIEGNWIKVPFDIVRSKECLSQSTIKLTREHDYGDELGRRQDTVILGLYNTTITDVGSHKVMLWFRRPPEVGGFWDFEAKAQDDCGGMLDLTTDRPRHASYKNLYLGPES